MSMLGDVHRGAAILAAHRKSLHDAREHQQYRGRDADRLDPGQQPDRGRRHTHQQDGLQEGALAAIAVADVAEEHRPERAARRIRPRTRPA